MIEQRILAKISEEQSSEVVLDEDIPEEYYNFEYEVCVDCGRVVRDCYGTDCPRSEVVSEYAIDVESVVSAVFGDIADVIVKDSDGFVYELECGLIVTVPFTGRYVVGL